MAKAARGSVWEPWRWERPLRVQSKCFWSFSPEKQRGALIESSTCTVPLLLSGPTWSSISVFWLPILPEERVQPAPLSCQLTKRRAAPPLEHPFPSGKGFPVRSLLSEYCCNNVRWDRAPECWWKLYWFSAVSLSAIHHIKTLFIPTLALCQLIKATTFGY